MDSKNKKIKEPGADKSIFNMVRDYCKAPWVSTNKELPIPEKYVLLAYYAGKDVGYKTAIGFLCKHPIKECKNENGDSYFYISNPFVFEKTIDVNHDSRDSTICYNPGCAIYSVNESNKYTDYEKEKNISSDYEIIEEDGEKKALIWFICATGNSAGIFKNSKSADSTFSPVLGVSPLKEEYSKPDFWMYIPDIK